MIGVEWLARYLPTPLITAVRAYLGRPRPDVRILELKETGGSHGKVTFTAHVQNYGTQPTRASASANVAGQEVECTPAVLDLLVNAPFERVTITVPRPELGDLVKEFDDATTLYGAELVVEITTGKQHRTASWREEIYEAAADPGHHEIQQRAWRFGRGQDTEADRRAEWLGAMPERMRQRQERARELERYDY